MSRPIFLSYARKVSAEHARKLAEALGEDAFLDTQDLEDGEEFPSALLEALLDSRVVVVFATDTYFDRWYCRFELRAAREAGHSEKARHMIVALPGSGSANLDLLPRPVGLSSWPRENETEKLVKLIRRRLDECPKPLRESLPERDWQQRVALAKEEASLPWPRRFDGSIPHRIPPAANVSIGDRFVGRADDLNDLHWKLSQATSTGAALTGRLTGGGGFGKTRLAIEYVHRYGPVHYPGGVFWIDGSGARAIESEWFDVYKALCPNDNRELKEIDDVEAELRRALEQAAARKVLFVVDNVPENTTDPLATRCPAKGSVTLLATSRRDFTGDGVHSIKVSPLSRPAAILMLQAGLSPRLLPPDTWDRLAAAVGDLPVALLLLNCILEHAVASPASIAERILAAPSLTGPLDAEAESLGEQVEPGYLRGVTEVFRISFESLDGPAKRLVLYLSHLGPEPIPYDLVEGLPDEFGGDPSIRSVRSRNLVMLLENDHDRIFYGQMHRLVADYLRGLGGGGESFAYERVNALLDPDKSQDPSQFACVSLVAPHAISMFNRQYGGSHIQEALAQVVVSVGIRAALYCTARGLYSSAHEFGVRVAEFSANALGEEHLDTLTSMNNLATTMLHQGHPAGAQKLLERVVEARSRLLGNGNQDTLVAMANLASSLFLQGDLLGAREIQEQVLIAMRRIYGDEHKMTLNTMTCLASTLSLLGALAEAFRLEQHVVSVRLNNLGEEHLDTLLAMSNFAVTLRLLGRLTEARAYQERVLRARSELLGKDHPDTLKAKGNLASTLQHQGDLAGACMMQREVLFEMRRALGEDHPDTLTAMNNLGVTLSKKGKVQEALGLLLEAEGRLLRRFAPSHPSVEVIQQSLNLVRGQGRISIEQPTS